MVKVTDDSIRLKDYLWLKLGSRILKIDIELFFLKRTIAHDIYTVQITETSLHHSDMALFRFF